MTHEELTKRGWARVNFWDRGNSQTTRYIKDFLACDLTTKKGEFDTLNITIRTQWAGIETLADLDAVDRAVNKTEEE